MRKKSILESCTYTGSMVSNTFLVYITIIYKIIKPLKKRKK